MEFKSMNPATEETIATYPAITEGLLEEKLQLSKQAFLEYRKTSFTERAMRMNEVARILEECRTDFARLITRETGKTIGGAVAEVEKCAVTCRYYADRAQDMLKDEVVEAGPRRSVVRYAPLGPVLAVMPWNFPFWQVVRFAAPALMAGNVGLLKHAPSVPECAIALQEIFGKAGFADGVFQNLAITLEQIEGLYGDDRIAAFTVTGSVGAGRAVASRAGKAIKKTVLELGGSDPFLVMKSADIPHAAAMAVKGRTINTGQSCIAAKRFIVEAAVYDEFRDCFVREMESLVVGDPTQDGTQIGPLSTIGILNGLQDQVERAQKAGAKVLTGGARLDRRGYYFAPTILEVANQDDAVFREEFFGPVALLFRARDARRAVELANDTSFGLAASVWTADAEEQDRFVNEVEAGAVFVNQLPASQPELPFGGIKQSGYGRELGVWGIREFVNTKTVVWA